MFVPKRAEKKYKIGMTFGGFDLCHVGHTNLLRNASELCDTLIVCVSTDEYMVRNKQVPPLLQHYHRVKLVELTGYATIIDTQDLEGKLPLINKYDPDVLLVGDDWDELTYEGEEYCETLYLPRTPWVSTTTLRMLI